MGLHNEFIPASKRYMNDYVQYVTSDFLAGLGFGAAQMLGERTVSISPIVSIQKKCLFAARNSGTGR